MQNFPSEVLNELRRHLEEEKKNIGARIRTVSSQDPFTDPDRLIDNAATDTEASEESNHDRVAAIIDELKKQLGAIDGALQRISEGTYGFCSNCKDMIDTDRLAILPTATLCLRCETKKKISINHGDPHSF